MAIASLTVEDIPRLAKLISLIAHIQEDVVDLKFDVDMFSIMFNISAYTEFVAALQLCSFFFPQYTSNLRDLDQFSRIFVHQMHPFLKDMINLGFTSFTISLDVPHCARLTFRDPHGQTREESLELYPASKFKDACEYDLSSAVTMETYQFVEIILQLSMFPQVLVTITSTEVKFASGRYEVTLSRQRGHEIEIIGVEEGAEIAYYITVHPMEEFILLVLLSDRVWLFKAINSSHGVIACSLGIAAQFLFYFPQIRN